MWSFSSEQSDLTIVLPTGAGNHLGTEAGAI
jgi:hypothetical protein